MIELYLKHVVNKALQSIFINEGDIHARPNGTVADNY